MVTPELLAPAGDWDSLKAACACGADAVYFGLSNFNARARASNFAPDELPRVMDYLHARNVRGFVAFNTLIFSDELEETARFTAAIAAAGVDAVIVQDVGLVRLIKAVAPAVEVHASTQMTLTEPRGVEWVKRFGVERVVLARELSLDDVRKVRAGTDMPVEVFVHGALCVAYSGQCLTSEALGGRSANRGQCAQACRLPYEMFVDGRHRDLGDRAYLLSPQDLAAHEKVAELLAAGVVSFKIEGRLKGPAYVALATRTYRRALDAAAAGEPWALPPAEQVDLQQTFSRGFTPGFLDGPDHQRLVQGRVPKSRGVRVGQVVGASRGGVRVRLTETRVPEPLKPGDGVVFDLGRPEDKEPGGRVYAVRPAGAGVVELAFERGTVIDVPAGTPVWRTDDPALRKRLESFRDEPYRREPLTAHVAGRAGGPLAVTLRAGGCEAVAEWPGPLESARKRPLTEESARDALGRLGDTPFELAAVTLDVPDPVMVPASVLNDLRRRTVADLGHQRRESRRRAVVEPDALTRLRAEAAGERIGDASPTPHLHVLVRTLEQLDAALPLRPASVVCDFEDVRRYRDAVPRARAAGVPVTLATLRVMKPGEEGFFRPLLAAEPDAVLVRNLGAVSYLQEHAPGLPLVGDFSLNVANELTAAEFARAGLARLVPSYDLNWEQLRAMLGRSDPARFEVVVHQHMPMFHMEHCVFAAFLSEGKDWRDCGRPCDRHRVELRDRVGAEFPVSPDAGCRNTVYNAHAQSAAEYLPRMLDAGVRHFRVELLREPAAEVAPLVDHYARVLAGADDGRATWRRLKALNQLGVTRGTLQMV